MNVLSDGFGFKRRTAETVEAGIDLEVESGNAVLGLGGFLVVGDGFERFDEDVQVVEDGLSSFYGKGRRHHHDGALNAGVTEGDAFLDACDAEPIGTIAGREPSGGDKAVPIGIGFADEAELDVGANAVADDAEVMRHRGKIDFSPGARIRLHGFILTWEMASRVVI